MIPAALIGKCVTAIDEGRDHIECWGTGSASREFLYVDDCAEGILRAAETLDEPVPVNLGTCMEITIRDLIELIARLTGFEGEIRWDATKPDGQPRRCLDTSRADDLLGWRADVGFEEGLRRTIDWFRANRASKRVGGHGLNRCGSPPDQPGLLPGRRRHRSTATTLRDLVAHGRVKSAIASRSIYGRKGGGSTASRSSTASASTASGGRSSGRRASRPASPTSASSTSPPSGSRSRFGPRRRDRYTAPFIAALGPILRWFKGSRCVYWVMDLYPDLPIACGVMKRDSIATRFFADQSPMPSNRRRGRRPGPLHGGPGPSKGTPEEKIELIGVWSDQEEVKPIQRSENEFRREWGIGDRTLVMYSGNFGIGHDVATFLEAAKHRGRRPDSIRLRRRRQEESRGRGLHRRARTRGHLHHRSVPAAGAARRTPEPPPTSTW